MTIQEHAMAAAKDPDHSPPDRAGTAILLIAHGSRQQAANDDLRALASRLVTRDGFPIVEPSFLELADPTIEMGALRCVESGATRVLIIPYFLSSGLHLNRDLTAAREDLSRQYPGVTFILGAPLGPHRLLDELVLERIRELNP
jgi:sirohydrochlorin ferrochelatase